MINLGDWSWLGNRLSRCSALLGVMVERLIRDSCPLDAIKHRLQPRCDELLRRFQLGFLSVQKTSAVFVKQLHIICIAAFLPCSVECSLAFVSQKGAEPISARFNAASALLPTNRWLWNGLASSVTINDGILEGGNKIHTLTSDVGIKIALPSKLVIGSRTNEAARDSGECQLYGLKQDLIECVHYLIVAIIAGFTASIYTRRMTPNDPKLSHAAERDVDGTGGVQ
jgi:hypothetical protein